MKTRYFYPLLGFVIPTLVIGYGVVIPRSCIAGLNDLTIGFATTVIGGGLRHVFLRRESGVSRSESTRLKDPPPCWFGRDHSAQRA